MKRYPDLEPAMAARLRRPSRISRILTPSVVLATVLVLAGMSTTGIVTAAAVFSSHSPHTMSLSAAQAFVLIAVSLDFSLQ